MRQTPAVVSLRINVINVISARKLVCNKRILMCY